MPIVHGTARECFNEFRGHMSPVVAAVIGTESHLQLKIAEDDTNRGVLQFNEPAGARIKTSRGDVFLEVQNHLRAEPEARRRVRLTTEKYRYALRGSSSELVEPLFRWEYEKRALQVGLHCRHHLQFGRDSERKARTMPLGEHTLDLNRIHIPTGWVLLEEVLRFLIVELGARPAHSDWDERLRGSESVFYQRFTSKRP